MIMSHTPVQRSWCEWPLRLLLVGLIMAGGSQAGAQPEKKPNLDKHVIEYLSFEKLLAPALSLIVSAIAHYDAGEYLQSIQNLSTILAGTGIYKPRRSLRAWSNQWLALNYFALDSVVTAKKYVKLSIEKEDVEIWREYAEFKRMPYDLRDIYQACWDSLQWGFDKKRKSIRLGIGTTSRIDFGLRYRFFEILAGIGIPIVVVEDSVAQLNQLLLYVRIQRMRKNIERLTAGLYFEFSLLEEDLKRDNPNFEGAISAGAVLAYPYKTGWEIGGSFELARLLFREKESGELPFSQTLRNSDFSLSLAYANFEIHIRKWF
jgi:hypothetical protein